MFRDPEDLALEAGPTWHGTAIGWPLEVNNDIIKLPSVSNLFCGVMYQNEKSRINILSYSVYLPTSGRDEEFLEVIDILSKDIHSNLLEDCSIIIGTDTNHSVKSSRRRKEAMNLFLKEFSFQSIILDDQPTFHHNNQTSESQIDHILYFIPEQIKLKLKLKDHLCQKEVDDNLSAHDVIVGDITFAHKETAEKKEPDYSNTYTDFKVKKPKWDMNNVDEYQEQTSMILMNL